jgi:hypothetical protein
MSATRLLPWLLGALALAGSGAAGEAPPEKLQVVRELVKLRGKDYCGARAALLGAATEKELRAAREACGDGEPLLALACDALLWRLANPKPAELLDRHGPAPTSGGPAGRGGSGDELWGDHQAARVLISCFGPEAMPALAEHLLYEDRPLSYRLTVIDTLVEMRDARTPGVLLAAAGRDGEEPRARAAAVWRLEKCLSGVPALNMPYGAGKGPVGFGPVPIPELAELAKPVKLPALEPAGAWHDKVITELCKLLGADKDARVRALIARALRHGGTESLPAIEKALSGDSSSWVRAWCADTLRRQGSAEIGKALQAARGTEKDAEVQAVIDGRAEPDLPENGLPGKSILRGR